MWEQVARRMAEDDSREHGEPEFKLPVPVEPRGPRPSLARSSTAAGSTEKTRPACSSKALRVALCEARISMGEVFPHCHPQLKPELGE